MIEVSLNGYTDVPAGKVANIATFLEMTTKPELTPSKVSDLKLERMDPPDFKRYKALFKAVGEDWLWFSRLAMSDEELNQTIQTPGFEIFVVLKDGQDAGLLELDVRNPQDIELGYFGLVPGAVGSGVGHWLMNHAITRVFDHHKAQRFFVHTCTMDHPAALKFYMRSGFVPYKRAIEIDDDPRLTGCIGRDMGKHHPIIE